MRHFPFTAIVGAHDMALALALTTVSPNIGGVLVRGEKGTAKSTMVRAFAEILPSQDVVDGCRFRCDPLAPDAGCPDASCHEPTSHEAPAALVELPVGASEDRVVGSLDLGKVLANGEHAFHPGLLAAAHRGILYVDEVNLLHDHLVDVLLDAAAMGRHSVERDGISVSHQARMVLIGTMNPEEGELRPQLLDRFGLTVEVAASRDPQLRADVVRRRLAFDADPEAFSRAYEAEQSAMQRRIAEARARLADVVLSDEALATIARVCAGFDVDGMRADIVTARAAMAHAAWDGRTTVRKDDIRAAAKLALPHRRRRKPFDAPGLDEDLLERLLEGFDDPEPDPEPDTDPDTDPSPAQDREENGPESGESAHPETSSEQTSADTPPSQQPEAQAEPPTEAVAPTGIATAGEVFRARTFTVRGLGRGEAGRRSRAITSSGHAIGSQKARDTGRLHVVATVVAAAPHQARRGRTGAMVIEGEDLRHSIFRGKESNVVLFVVDASGSMAARKRMSVVKTAVLSLLFDAYQRRDKVAMITFRGDGAELVLPATSSVEAAARCLEELPHGGRTPLAEGLQAAARTLELEQIRDPRRRALVVVVTDGRATSGPGALTRAQQIADRWAKVPAHTVVVDCEAGRMRLGLAHDLAARMNADYVALDAVAAEDLVSVVKSTRAA